MASLAGTFKGLHFPHIANIERVTVTRISSWQLNVRKLFHVLQSIVPRKVPITLEEEDKEIVELFQAGKPCHVWYIYYEEKYNIPLTFPQKSEGGWQILE